MANMYPFFVGFEIFNIFIIIIFLIGPYIINRKSIKFQVKKYQATLALNLMVLRRYFTIIWSPTSTKHVQAMASKWS